MTTQHLTFIRKLGTMAIVVSVVDSEILEGIPNEAFVVSTTSKSIYSGMMPCIKLSDQTISTPGEEAERVRGHGIDGILTSPNWFIRKIKTGLEDLTG